MNGGSNDPPGREVGDTRQASHVMQPRELTPGTSLGPYVVVRELGRGGMGVVYLGTDVRLDRPVAIKLVSLESPAVVSRFMAEARLTARCRHPNIVVVYDVGEDDGRPYMVLEYVEGESVLAMLQGGPVPAHRVVAIMTQVARGLAFAHSLAISHQDLKPANILVTADGTPKIVDFGIAKALDVESPGAAVDGGRPGARDATGSSLVGTLHYLAPEQVRGTPTDDRVDVWSFGVTMYQLLSGTQPFNGLSRAEVLDHLSDLDREVPRLDVVAPDLPPALVELTHRCLEKHPELRLASANELVAALEALPPTVAGSSSPPAEGGGRSATGTSSATAEARPWRRLGLARGAGLVAMMLLVVTLAAVWLLAGRPGPGSRVGDATPDPRIDARVAALAAEVARLDRQGAKEAGDRLLDELIREEREPRALALAWLERGDRALRHHDPDAAVASYAGAYARASDVDTRRRGLLALATLYLERWEWARLAVAMDVYDTIPGGPDPRGDALRERLQLALRLGVAALTSSPVTRTIAQSVLVGRPTGLDLTSAVTVDVDGDGERELVAIEGDDLVVRTAYTLRERARRPHDGLHALRCSGRDDRGAYVVGRTADETDALLVPLDGGAVVPLARFGVSRFPERCRWIDLDGERGEELYVLGGREVVRVARDPDGSWSARTWEVGSQVGDLIGGDLDGDGRRELVLSVGEWRAYDVRLLRLDADGTLRIHDRVRLGLVPSLADLGRDPDGGARIAALKVDHYPTVRDLPADQPFGAPAGLYVLRLRGDHLEVLRHVELPGILRNLSALGPLQVADLDGNAHRDLLVHVALVPEQQHPMSLMVMLGQPDGGFATRVVSGQIPLAVIAGAGDGADAIVARVEGAATTWILGGGTEHVPPVDIPKVPEGEPDAAATRDPSIALAWQRAEQLARIGQVEAAADALQRVALTASPEVKPAALRRASVLLAAAGRPAAAPLEVLAELPTATDRQRAEAWLAAIDDDLHHVALGEGGRRLARLRASGLSLTADEAARLAVQADQLVGAPLVVFAGDTLASTWRVVDPSLVHVVPGSSQLTVETLTPGVVASLPLTGGERGLTLAIDAAIVRTEFAGNITFRLGPRDRAAVGGIEVEIGARGGGRLYRREYVCRGSKTSHAISEPLPDADAPVPVHIEISFVPSRGRGRCSITAGTRTMTVDLDVAPRANAEWELSIGASALADMTSAVARISTIAIAGVAPLATPPTPLDAAALALANYRADVARTLLADLDHRTATTWPARRLEAMAADETGHRRAAVAALKAAMAGPAASRPSLRNLAPLARARDGQFAPMVRSASGRGEALLLEAAWSTTAHHELDEPRVRATLIRDFDRLPPTTAETREATLSLLGYHGEALFDAARPSNARRILADALALVHPNLGLEARTRSVHIAYLLAIDGAARGDEATARRWALASLELGDHPELAADRLLLDPATRALAAGPGWERVRSLGRPVVSGVVSASAP